MKPNILIINTGGTISCIKTAHGYEPVQGYVESILATIPALSHPDMPAYVVHEYEPLLDSANITLTDWNRIAQDIATQKADFDGFIVLHGTDTMAYTASALSFMLENLKKPVIITGSQIPLSEVRNDAIDNILTSLWLCAHHPLQEVCVYFGQKLFRGNRTQKISTTQFSAFASPNYPELATVGIEVELHPEYLLKPTTHTFRLQLIESHFIANFRLFPGFSMQVLESLLQQPSLQGLVLETYGAGNAQNNEPYFLELLKNACAQGVIIVNCTQCLHGRVEMSQYATGYALRQAGLISGGDMTLEAVHCKLLYLLSKYTDREKIKTQMQRNLFGERSESLQ